MEADKNDLIRIAFCFDENMMRQACVTIGSLLDYKDSDTHFEIFCVCTEGARQIQDILIDLVKTKDSLSSVSFHQNTLNLEKGFEIRGITVSTYFRLNLHQMFPNIDRMIYSDVDIIFQDDIMPVWKYDLNNNLLAGVKADVNIREVWDRHYEDEYWKQLDDWFGNYINAGFILMNLSEMRNRQMEKVWSGMYEEKFFFQDQDILNMTCKPLISHLPMRYNRLMFYSNEELSLLKWSKVVKWMELEEALDTPAVIHYAGNKPWNRMDTNGADIWWNYVENDPIISRLFKRDIKRWHFSRIIRQIKG